MKYTEKQYDDIIAVLKNEHRLARTDYNLVRQENKQLKDKLHRRNQLANGRLREIKELQEQIKDLKKAKENIYPKTIAELILVNAVRWLKGELVDNPMKGLQGTDCDAITTAENAISKVCSI